MVERNLGDYQHFQFAIDKLDGTTGRPYRLYTSGLYTPGLAGAGARAAKAPVKVRRHTAESLCGLSICYPPSQAPGGIAVHPDGTIFALVSDSSGNSEVVGIDPTTGARKFGVPLPPAANAVEPHFQGESGIIIGGDGYAYAAYTTLWRIPGNGQAHITVVRVDSQGSIELSRCLRRRDLG